MQVGQCPVLMFYVAGSARFGTIVLTTANGSQAADSVQRGLQRWPDRLDDKDKVAIIKRRYGNTSEAIDKFRLSNPEEAQDLFPEDMSEVDATNFNTQGFLVSYFTISECLAHPREGNLDQYSCLQNIQSLL